MKKLHGLNTRQDIAFNTVLHATNGNSLSQQAEVFYFSHSSTQNLRNLLFSAEIPASTREYYVKRYYCRHTFVNTLPYPTIFEHSIVRARADIPRTTAQTNLPTAMEYALTNGLVPGIDWIKAPYASIFASPFFRKTFKIVKSKRYVMKPGKLYNVKDNLTRSLLNRPIMNSKEGNTDQTIILKGGHVHIFRLYGTPIFNNGSSGAESCLTNHRVVQLTNFYASWYNMDDAQDNQQLTPLGARSALETDIPTMYHGVKPQTLFVFPPHVLAGVNGGFYNDDVSILGMSEAQPLIVAQVTAEAKAKAEKEKENKMIV